MASCGLPFFVPVVQVRDVLFPVHMRPGHLQVALGRAPKVRVQAEVRSRLLAELAVHGPRAEQLPTRRLARRVDAAPGTLRRPVCNPLTDQSMAHYIIIPMLSYARPSCDSP